MANTGRGESKVAFPGQRDKAIYNSILIPGKNIGNTQGELYPVLQNIKVHIQFILTDLLKMI